ncbi:MAG TPA: hypothetical protein VHZ95_03745 [Polyangiales bacterium]|jgi:hypothetical protein|nr:hypothetical protein [Polyangiales bacterium]
MTQSEQDLNTYMAIACAVAVEEAKTMPTTPDLQRRAHAIAEAARDRMAQIRREERAKRPSNIVSGAIREAIKAMSPVRVLARLSELRVLHPEMQFAHRNFEHLSDDDLRSALEDVESLIERGD